LLDLPLAVGGRTALEQLGYAHYLSAELQEVHLYGPKRVPTWLVDLPLDVKFRWHNSLRLFPGDADAPPEPSPVMLSAAEDCLPPAAMAVGTHDEIIGTPVFRFGQQALFDTDIAFGRDGNFRIDAVS